MRMSIHLALPLAAGLILSACAQDPEWANRAALTIGAPRADAAAIRERQTGRFLVGSEERLLIEATQVLQDLGLRLRALPASDVLAGSKDRDATEAPQVVAQVALTVGLALLGVRYQPVWDTDQVIRATLTTRPVGPQEVSLRVSFERIVTNNQGATRVEELTAPEFSTGFFEQVRAGLGRRT